jgi:hypothetical protein
MGLDPEEIIEESKKFTAKQIAVIIALIVASVTGVLFFEDRYAKNKEIKSELDVTKNEIKRINDEMKTQVTTMSVLIGQMSAILNSGSGRIIQPINIPSTAPALTPEILSQIEAARPKISGNDAAVSLQNDLLKQQASIAEQQKRLQKAQK